MSLKKKLLFNCFDGNKVISVSGERGRIFLNRTFTKNAKHEREENDMNHLIYTKEDDIYKINNVDDSFLARSSNKEKIEMYEDKVNIISNKNFEKIGFSSRYKKEDNYKCNSDKCLNEKIETSIDTLKEPNYLYEHELRLYKNRIKIPLYWINKLNRLKNINAINCIEYLKDDNMLYFDSYKNKGLLKFLNDEKKKYSNCIILSRVGDFYETYGLDSIFLIEFLNIKKMNNKLSCGFIKSSINKALNILTNNNLNICIYEEMNEKSLKLKKRFLSQIVTPEFPIYLNNIQYCVTGKDDTISSDENGTNPFYNSCDLDNHFAVKEIVCIYIESKNVFSLSKINLSLKTISIYDNITYDVLNVYLKNTNFLKAYIHQHNNMTFTKKITQLFKIENYYLFSNFDNSLHFHMFVLDKLKRQININGLFRLIKNRNVFKLETSLRGRGDPPRGVTQSGGTNGAPTNARKSGEPNNATTNGASNKVANSYAVGETCPSNGKTGIAVESCGDSVSKYANGNESKQNMTQGHCTQSGKSEKMEEMEGDNTVDREDDNIGRTVRGNNFDYSYYSYCTPLNIFTSYNMGIYKQSNYYENRNSYLFYNIVDVNNTDSKSIYVAESLEFFKNLFLFYPPFEVTKHIRYINEYIKKNIKSFIIPNIKPFRNNIVITLLSNLKADHVVLNKIFMNIKGVLKCMNNFDFSILVSIFHILNHQNSFKLNLIKFYELLINIEKILRLNLDASTHNFSYQSDIPLFNDFVYSHENETYHIINDNLLIEQNQDVEKSRKELLHSILTNYGNYDEKEKKYDIDLLNRTLKIDNTNDIIGVKKKKKNEKMEHFFHPLNKKADTMKNVFVTEMVQKKIKSYITAIDRKKRRINDVVRNMNVQLSPSVHILSFASNFLQIVQKHFHSIGEKLQYMQRVLYGEGQASSDQVAPDQAASDQAASDQAASNQAALNQAASDQEVSDKANFCGKRASRLQNGEKKTEVGADVEAAEAAEAESRDSHCSSADGEFVTLTAEEEKRISRCVDAESVEEIKKMYMQKNYVNDSLTYILGAKPYNISKEEVVKYDVFFKKKNFMLLTGENMSGKTTLSFSILCILFLANLGMYAPCEERSIVSKFREFYSLKNVNYQEQIENMSLFREQTYYINTIIEEIKEKCSFHKNPTRDREIFILLDEPCIATTPLDNAIIISAVSDYLKSYCGIIITHNYDLLKKICHSKNIVFKRICESINYLKMHTREKSAVLENGICKSSEALETCKHTNIDCEVLRLLQIYERKYKFVYNLSNNLYYKFLYYLRHKKGKKELNNFFNYFTSNYSFSNGDTGTSTYPDHLLHKGPSDPFLNRELESVLNPRPEEGDSSRLQSGDHGRSSNEDMNVRNSQLEGRNSRDMGDLAMEDLDMENRDMGDLAMGDLAMEDRDMENLDMDSFHFGSLDTNLQSNGAVLDERRNGECYEEEVVAAIEKIESAVGRKLTKVEMNEDVPIFFKDKSIVYILCIFARGEKKPFIYIGISDNISDRLKMHRRNLRNNKNLLKNPKKNSILNYKFNFCALYTLLFHVENKMVAANYEKELSLFLKSDYDILSK
ncbi:DNA mismatch repair protein, putative [Plasmodium ovale]|uniref:DNA mismatch repair protein, putative n=1 Tax=Plasmodium ovale TaxID=36330 RepID=A0A1C3KXQ0_PLAOA|nr:DNA mismatch repair protein, putative [Plasmodium ovale]